MGHRPMFYDPIEVLFMHFELILTIPLGVTDNPKYRSSSYVFRSNIGIMYVLGAHTDYTLGGSRQPQIGPLHKVYDPTEALCMCLELILTILFGAPLLKPSM